MVYFWGFVANYRSFDKLGCIQVTIITTNTDIWQIKTSTFLEKPCYILIGFQTGCKLIIGKDESSFDHVNITNLKYYLNSEAYPYEKWSLDILQYTENQYTIAYQSYTNFQSSYYGGNNKLLLTFILWKKYNICNRLFKRS